MFVVDAVSHALVAMVFEVNGSEVADVGGST